MSDLLTPPLDAKRADELEAVLEHLTKQVVQYVRDTDSGARSVGVHVDPLSLVKKMNISLPEEGTGAEGLYKSVETILDNSVNTWHPGFLDKLYASTNPVGVASDLILSILNTNSHVFTVSPALTVIEKKTAKAYANLIGLTGPRAGGLTFPGGSYSNSTSLNIARGVMFPEIRKVGFNSRGPKLAIFASAHAHYSVEKAAIFCGLGSDALYKVNIDVKTGRMDVADLESKILKAKADGRVPFYISATAGTTVYGSYDDLVGISALGREHGCWLHVDGSWGANVAFSETHRAKIRGIENADSVTVNPHKMLGVPCTCSFLLLADESLFQRANSLDAPYLFHSNSTTPSLSCSPSRNSSDVDLTKSNGDSDLRAQAAAGSLKETNANGCLSNGTNGSNPPGDIRGIDENLFFDLADGTMGCGRRADALKLYMGWNWYGTKGYGKRVDHAFAVTEYFARKINDSPNFVLVSELPPPCLQTCFFYAPNKKLSDNKEENSAVTHGIVGELFRRSLFLVDYAPDGEGRGDFFRVVINSPNVTSKTVDALLTQIEEIGQQLF